MRRATSVSGSSGSFASYAITETVFGKTEMRRAGPRFVRSPTQVFPPSDVLFDTSRLQLPAKENEEVGPRVLEKTPDVGISVRQLPAKSESTFLIVHSLDTTRYDNVNASTRALNRSTTLDGRRPIYN